MGVSNAANCMAGGIGVLLTGYLKDDFGLEVRDTVGVDQITFESDYPHQDSNWPNTHREFARAVAGIKALAGLIIQRLQAATRAGR